VLVTCLIGARPAVAMRACGDDVDGRGTAVPCACGDLLVSSRTLRAADRITHKSCPGPGLLVAAPGPVTLAFDGHTIHGEGRGIGIQVVRGTLSLTGPGTIEGFATGVMARGPRALGSVVGMRFSRNHMWGLVVNAQDYDVVGNVAEGNRDGFTLGGSNYAVDGNRAAGNRRHGFVLSGRGAHVGGGLGNESVNNGKSGFWMRGMLHEVVGATADGNGGYGFFAAVMHTLLVDVHAEHSARDGVRVIGMDLAIQGSSARTSHGLGVRVIGPRLEDRGGNSGVDNAGLMGMAGIPSPLLREAPALVQCRVGDAACR